MSDFDDGIPGPSIRPDCKEFWQLSEIVLGLDASIENVQNDEQFQGIVKSTLGNRIPVEVIDYMAMQRTMRILENLHPLLLALAGPGILHAWFMSAWSDAFVAGMEYQRKYGEVEAS